ncbi:hypothetical protein ACJX0J_017918, partial [Zea mays]
MCTSTVVHTLDSSISLVELDRHEGGGATTCRPRAAVHPVPHFQAVLHLVGGSLDGLIQPYCCITVLNTNLLGNANPDLRKLVAPTAKLITKH